MHVGEMKLTPGNSPEVSTDTLQVSADAFSPRASINIAKAVWGQGVRGTLDWRNNLLILTYGLF
jgi:hypothetical protein